MSIIILCLSVYIDRISVKKALPKTSQVINKFSLKVAQKHATYKPGLVGKYNIQEMELVKGSAHALVYETGLLIGHTHILFYFIFQLLVQKHKISTIKGVWNGLVDGHLFS